MFGILFLIIGCDGASPADVLAPVSSAPAPSAAIGPTGVDALQGNLGALVEVTPPPGISPASLKVRVHRDGLWTTACRGTTRCYLASPVEQVQVLGAGGLWRSPVVAPRELTITLQPSRTDGAYWADEAVQVDLIAPDLDLSVRKITGLYLERGDTEAWWDRSTAGWTDRPAKLPGGELRLTVDSDEPTPVQLRGVLAADPDGWTVESAALHAGPLTEGVGPLGEALAAPLLPLADEAATVVLLGRHLLWGDVHAHSDLSHDACAFPDDSCSNTADDVGWGFFDSAVEQGLDFAAMTDHAEWTDWQASPDATTSIDIWERQRDVVADAREEWEEDGFIPVIGYEWTDPAVLDDDGVTWHGGHRTVLLEDPGDCTEARVAATGGTEDSSHTKLSTGPTFTGVNDVIAGSISTLVDALDDAVETCDLDTRILTIPHHPAWKPPSPVDWNNPDNAPDERYEMLLEIHSEHGASECIDPDAEHCSWRPRPGGTYVSSGSAQAALLQGYRFGFVGGTDSHDANPGTVEDDPSCTAFWASGDGTLRCHEWKGALTGVLAADTGDRAALFDGMTSRTTYATSGPRLAVRAWVQTPDGDVYLPGEDVPAVPGAVLSASVEDIVEHLPYDSWGLDLLDATGEILRSTEETTLQHELEAGAGEVRYVRLRLYGEDEDATDDDAGERMWLSPWFFDAD